MHLEGRHVGVDLPREHVRHHTGLDEVVEFAAVSGDSGHLSHRGAVEDPHHERLVWNPFPLGREAVRGGAIEPKARVVPRVSDHHDERAAAPTQEVEAVADEGRADSLALPIREDGHRRESRSDHGTRGALDGDGSEEDVADDGFVFGHERQGVGAGVLQPFDQVSLERLAEGKLVDAPYVRRVVRSLMANVDHEARRVFARSLHHVTSDPAAAARTTGAA